MAVLLQLAGSQVELAVRVGVLDEDPLKSLILEVGILAKFLNLQHSCWSPLISLLSPSFLLAFLHLHILADYYLSSDD